MQDQIISNGPCIITSLTLRVKLKTLKLEVLWHLGTQFRCGLIIHLFVFTCNVVSIVYMQCCLHCLHPILSPLSHPMLSPLFTSNVVSIVSSNVVSIVYMQQCVHCLHTTHCFHFSCILIPHEIACQGYIQ